MSFLSWGDIFTSLLGGDRIMELRHTLRIGVVGLGAGTLAAYGEAGDYVRFYEINPLVISLARGRNGFFSYLSVSQAKVEVVEGDARLSLENELAAGQPQRAQRENERALKESNTSGNRWAVAIALRVGAEIGTHAASPNWGQVEANLIDAVNIFRQIRARPDLARTYLALRRLYDRAGQTAWAVDCHFRATTIFEEMGMDEELRRAQGQAAGERKGAVVISNMPLRGPNAPGRIYRDVQRCSRPEAML